VLLRHLRTRVRGKVAVAARSPRRGPAALEGADVLLRPYADAAEQAVDAITTAMDRLSAVASATPGSARSASPRIHLGGASHRRRAAAREFGVTVLAVSRAGRSFFNPGPTFQLFPGDRLILSGEPANLERAVEYLARRGAQRARPRRG
jgi:Trk K+ transport system NAD-binding subunit